MNLNVIPKPNIIEEDTVHVLKVNLPFVFDGQFERAEIFGIQSGEAAVLHFEKDQMLPEEGYRIQVAEDGVTIASSSGQGAFYAMMTLQQMLGGIERPHGELCYVKIEDKPKYAYRGLMMDVSRHFFSVEEVKKIIDQCSRLKLNYFHLHLSDNEGFRIESNAFPMLNKIGSYCNDRKGQKSSLNGYYTKKQIRDIIEYAAERYIEIVPEIDMPAHALGILQAYPSLTCHGKPISEWSVEDRFKGVLCAGKASTYTFIFELLDEILELFPGKYFHIGGDEAEKELWKACPYCQAKMQEEELKDEEELQAFFMTRIINYLKSKGKTVVGWNELLHSDTIPEGTVIQYWEENGKAYCSRAIPGSRKFIFSNAPYFYLDYSHAMTNMGALYGFEPFVEGMGAVPAQQVLGIEGPLWTENYSSDEQIEKQLFPRLLALAEAAWTEKRDYADFLCRAPEYLKWLEVQGIVFTKLEDAVISGEAAVKSMVEECKSICNMFSEMGFPGDMSDRLQKMAVESVYKRIEVAYGEEEMKLARNLLSDQVSN